MGTKIHDICSAMQTKTGLAMCLLLGIGIGILLANPLLGFKLDSNAAALIGAALGAAITVLGAFVVTGATEIKTRRALKAVARDAMNIVTRAVDDLREAIRHHESQDGHDIDEFSGSLEAIKEKARYVHSCAGVVGEQFSELKEVFFRVGPAEARVNFHITHALKDMQDALRPALKLEDSEGIWLYTQQPETALGDLFSAYDRAIEELNSL